ncbi:MAG: hypothetical protein JO244_10090, partial [Solirubrobacterales bacterium]|nr:hypothetical protein [Solirubrobacterales bacterium]
MTEPLSPPDFLSGTSGLVFGKRATTRAIVADATADLRGLVQARPLRLRRATGSWPRRRVLALGIERADESNLLARAQDELLRSRHAVDFHSIDVGGRGKFENLNLLLEQHSPEGYDWLIALDDDVALPRG